jgi:hypothetical protein
MFVTLHCASTLITRWVREWRTLLIVLIWNTPFTRLKCDASLLNVVTTCVTLPGATILVIWVALTHVWLVYADTSVTFDDVVPPNSQDELECGPSVLILFIIFVWFWCGGTSELKCHAWVWCYLCYFDVLPPYLQDELECDAAMLNVLMNSSYECLTWCRPTHMMSWSVMHQRW